MLGIFVLFGCVLMTCAGPPISGYTLGTLSGGRGQEYSSGYRSGGFVGMTDSQVDPSDYPSPSGLRGGVGYATAGSNRYSVLTSGSTGHQSPATSYTSDSGYSDASGVQSAGYGVHSASVNPEAMSLSSSSYSSDASGTHGSSSDLGTGSYTSSGSSPGLGGYSSVGTNSGNHVTSGFVGYSDSAGGQATSNGGERNSGDYSSSSRPSGSYVSYTVAGGPKPSAYKLSNGGQGHGYSSLPSYMSVGHRGGSSQHPSSSSYSSESSRPGHSSSLSSFLASLHNGGPGSYVASGGGSHRGGSPNHPFAMASNSNPIYSSRGPSSGYFAGGSHYPRGGGKIILVKEGNGGHSGHGYAGEQQLQQHGYNGGMFGAASGIGYKIRSVGSGSSYGPGHAVGYSTPGGYANGGGHSSPGGSHVGNLFGLL